MQRKSSFNWLRGFTLACLLLLFALLSLGSRQLSFTLDEPSHLAAGYTWLARGEAGLWTMHTRAHPLLVDAWEALPLYLGAPDLPLESFPGWQTNYEHFLEHFTAYLEPAARSEVAGRTPAMLLTVLLAAVVFRWAADLGGPWAGLLALGIMIFDPNLLAHGRLATNDLGLMALGTLTLYAGTRWLRKPSWRLTVVLGALVAVTLLAKVTGVLYAAVFGVQAVVMGFSAHRSGRYWAQFVLIVLLSFLLLWAVFGFSIGPVAGLPLPVSLPAPLYWDSLFVQSDSAAHRLVFALGMRYGGRRWWYFPVAFLLKNPLPLLIGLGIALAGVRRFRKNVGKTVCADSLSCFASWFLTLGLFPLLYGMVILVKGMNIGYRHLLPIHPFLYLFMGVGLVAVLRRSASWKQVLLGLLGLWYSVSTVWLCPHELTYFSDLIGGSSQGYRYLVDSNLDWGQSYKALQDWLALNPEPRPKVVAFSFHPQLYEIAADQLVFTDSSEPLTPYAPAPGRYIIEASLVQGVFGPHAGEDWFSWFRYATPTAQIANALFVYDVPAYDGTWVAQCMTPARALSPNKIATRINPSARQVQFDCTNAWVYPTAGAEVGWYLLRGEHFTLDRSARLSYSDPVFHDAFQSRHLADSRLSMLHPELTNLPPFALYETLSAISWPGAAGAFPAAAATQPLALAEDLSIDEPISLDGPLDFLGSRVFAAEDALEAETWWQVKGDPGERPFSVMAHLLTAGGETLAVADGFSVNLETVRAGDLVVQRHRFPVQTQGDALWLRTGGYWLDTMDLWPVSDYEGDALFVPLPEME